MTFGLVGASCKHETEPPPQGRTSSRASNETLPPGPLPDVGARPQGQPEDQSSGGRLKLPGLRASRSTCVSPCPVMFSIDAATDSSDDNPFAHSGVYWDYGDPDADTRDGRIERGGHFFQTQQGATRTSDTNTPLGMHTYQCAEGICTFHPGVSIRNAAGDWVTGWASVQVRAQSTAYPATRTVCVSASGRWGGEEPCPADAEHASQLPALGSWKNDTRYLLRRGEAFDSQRACIGYGRRGITLASFGDAADPKPELAAFGVGRSRSCGRATTTDREIDRYAVPFWVEDITLTDLRVASVALGMTFKNIALHDLDMDFERQREGGVVYMQTTDRCSKDPELSCSRVPLPYGLYISSTTIVGSRIAPPGVNVGLVNAACPSFVGLLDTEIRVAEEHNVRLECSSRFLALHSDINGEHIGKRGRKSAITIRPEGTLAQDMLLGRRTQFDSPSDVFESRYTVFKDLYLGTPRSVNNSVRLAITPTQDADSEVSRYGVVSGNVTDMGEGMPHADARLAGSGLVCYDDNTWQSQSGCEDSGRANIPEQGYSPAQTQFPAPQVPDPPASYSVASPRGTRGTRGR